MNKGLQTNYLGDIKASYALIERMKQYYYHRGIPLNGAKFWVDSELDQFGAKMYCIRSNLSFNVAKGIMTIG